MWVLGYDDSRGGWFCIMISGSAGWHGLAVLSQQSRNEGGFVAGFKMEKVFARCRFVETFISGR